MIYFRVVLVLADAGFAFTSTKLLSTSGLATSGML
jgi:hypothetical protein